MRFTQQLRWRLAKIIDHSLDGLTFNRVGNLIQVDGTFVRTIIEYVQRFDSARTLLLVPEYQIDPVMQILRNVFRFEGATMDCDKVFRSIGPTRQNDVVDAFAGVLQNAQIESANRPKMNEAATN